MYNIRLALAFLFPGFIPTIFLIFVLKREESIDLTALDITLYIIGSIFIGIFIDFFRHRIEKPFINYFGFTKLRMLIGKCYKFVFCKEYRVINLKKEYLAYDEKDKEVIRLWIQTRLDKNTSVIKKIEKSDILNKEYHAGTITVGDRWVLLNILQPNSVDFFMKEYHSFYQFSFNCLIAFLITWILSIILFLREMINSNSFLWIFISCSILIWFLHERTIHWILSCKRYLRKIILYSIISSPEDEN